MTQIVKIAPGLLAARTLAEAGVSDIFALHGGHLEAFYRACGDLQIRLVDFRHEAAAGNAAEGYARVTGKLGVCVITAGPGFANAMPAILNAQVDATPVLFIIGAPPLREAETNALQGGFDQIAMSVPAVKWAHRVTNGERIPDLVAMAIRHALTGRRGPVLLELPIDVLHSPVAEGAVSKPTGLNVLPRPEPARQEVDQFIKLLKTSKRPAIIVGGDARFSGCQEALVRFAERGRIPVFASKRGLGIMPADHALYGHEAAAIASLQARGQQGPDLVLLLGTRLGLFLGGRGYAVLPRDAKLVQVYSDPAEIGRIREIELAIQADARSFLERVLEDSSHSLPDWAEWSQTATSLHRNRAEKYPDKELKGIHPFHAATVIGEVFGKEAIYSIDGGEAGQWAVQNAEVNHPGHVMTTGYFGGLGVAPGFAIGAQIASPHRRVVVVTGDGSVGFNIQELDTMVRWKLPIVTVVLNNEIWGMSIHGQQIMFGPNYSAISKLGGANYANIAQAFGCHAERVERYEDIRPALERAIASGLPSLVEIMTDPDVVSPGLVNMLGRVDDPTKEVMIPYYENIPSYS